MLHEYKEVMRKIIYAVESGGQVYGKEDYACFEVAGTNSEEEKAITIGAGQFYATEAKELLQRIKKADRTFFTKTDTVNINKDLRTADWTTYDLALDDPKVEVIKALIDSEVGRKCQDEMVDEQIELYRANAEKIGVKTVAAQLMCANWEHQGGFSAVTRLVNKCIELYEFPTLENLYKTCGEDTGNQVGAYKQRQKFVYTELLNRVGIVDESIYLPVVPYPEPSKNVEFAQKKFNYLYDFNVEESGVWDDYCRSSFIKALQWTLNYVYNEGLVVDGEYGPLTQRAVNRHVLKGGEGLARPNLYVKLIQIALYKAEFTIKGQIDGMYGQYTKEAVKKFQESCGLEADGEVGILTVAEMIK